VRVNVQLIKAANDSHLWADTFDRKLTDIFSVESDIAKAVADNYERDSQVRKSKLSLLNQQIILKLMMRICAVWPIRSKLATTPRTLLPHRNI
jgi:hypothetical protein